VSGNHIDDHAVICDAEEKRSKSIVPNNEVFFKLGFGCKLTYNSIKQNIDFNNTFIKLCFNVTM
jgi:hypothetical protein